MTARAASAIPLAERRVEVGPETEGAGLDAVFEGARRAIGEATRIRVARVGRPTEA